MIYGNYVNTLNSTNNLIKLLSDNTNNNKMRWRIGIMSKKIICRLMMLWARSPVLGRGMREVRGWGMRMRMRIRRRRRWRRRRNRYLESN